MSPTTQYIIEGIVAFVLIGVIGYILVQVFGGGGGGGGGGSCWPGTQKYQAGGDYCFSCDPSQSPCQTCTTSNPGACLNGGACVAITDSGIGACNCVSPYFGANCEKVCDETLGIKCQNGGTCVNGQCRCPSGYEGVQCETKSTIPCSPSTCQPPGCIYQGPGQCSCLNDGYITSPNSTTRCNTCRSDRFPKPDDPNQWALPCTQKLFTTPIKVTLPYCATGWDAATADSRCKQTFGSSASYTGKDRGQGNPDQCSEGCDLGASYARCNIPSYYAPADFNPSYWNSMWGGPTCPSTPGSSYAAFVTAAMKVANN